MIIKLIDFGGASLNFKILYTFTKYFSPCNDPDII